MDFEALDRDAVVALRMLPEELLRVIPLVVLRHKDQLGTVLPQMFEVLKPHVMAGMTEGAMGILDKDAMEATLMRALATVGVDVPKVDPLVGRPPGP